MPISKFIKERFFRKRNSILKMVFLLLILGPIVGYCLLHLIPALFSPELLSFQQVQRNHQRSDFILFDRKNRPLHETRVHFDNRKLQWVPLTRVSPSLLKILIPLEDKRFYSHNGVDVLSILHNVFRLFTFRRPHGASTLTMQLTSFVTPSLHPISNRRNPWQKFRQILAALQLEKSWSKKQILEAYLNLISFRSELQGLAAASWALFHKHPQGLNSLESLILTMLIRRPDAKVEKVIQRTSAAKKILNLPLSAKVIAETIHLSLKPPYRVPLPLNLAPHMTQKILRLLKQEKNYPLEAKSTLDLNLQVTAIHLLRQYLLQLHTQNAQDGAILVVENKTGNVLAYVGNSGDLSSSQVDGIESRRLAGSTLKPFLYAEGIEKKILTSSSLLLDDPLNLSLEMGIYHPLNYDRRYRGLVTVRQALASSLNIPAVKALNLVGLYSFLSRLQAFGFKKIREPDFYGPSAALGSLEISLWELVNAYRTLANKGVWTPLNFFSRWGKTSSHGGSQALSPQTSYIISHILSDREARGLTFSLESPLGTSFWTAVKTGTSKDMRDNWCVGYSQKYTVGVWVGNFSGESMWNVSGMSGAAPIWSALMKELHRKIPSSPPPLPAGVAMKEINIKSLNKTYQEVFLESTLPITSQVKKVVKGQTPKILYPPSGLLGAIDPDIPSSRQRFYFLSNIPQNLLQKFYWILNGKIIGRAGHQAFQWRPGKGRFQLSLQGPSKKVYDSVAFEIR